MFYQWSSRGILYGVAKLFLIAQSYSKTTQLISHSSTTPLTQDPRLMSKLYPSLTGLAIPNGNFLSLTVLPIPHRGLPSPRWSDYTIQRQVPVEQHWHSKSASVVLNVSYEHIHNHIHKHHLDVLFWSKHVLVNYISFSTWGTDLEKVPYLCSSFPLSTANHFQRKGKVYAPESLAQFQGFARRWVLTTIGLRINPSRGNFLKRFTFIAFCSSIHSRGSYFI